MFTVNLNNDTVEASVSRAIGRSMKDTGEMAFKKAKVDSLPSKNN
jgi:hypothetical protein